MSTAASSEQRRAKLTGKVSFMKCNFWDMSFIFFSVLKVAESSDPVGCLLTGNYLNT